jgi:Zn-dependent peptidase ImmA (M78 family)/DNA-binding XRE family transcriptional regulator
MDVKHISNNIRKWRITKGYSQKTLAEKAGVSLLTIKKLESGENQPRMNTLEAISKGLEIRLYDLIVYSKPLKTVRFRSTQKTRSPENILTRIGLLLEDYSYLEDVLDDKLTFELNQIHNILKDRTPIEIAAYYRKKLGLNSTEPVYDISNIFEKAGVKILFITIKSDGIFGLSVGKEDGGSAVIVNDWDRITVERKIFTAFHELGHLILHPDAYDVTIIDENEKEEKEADLFASHFLMPQEGFIKEWDETYGLSLIERVFVLKNIYRVSYQSVLHRLIESGITDSSIKNQFQKLYQLHYHKILKPKQEPLGLKNIIFIDNRFRRLIRKAIEKDEISLSRGAEMLNLKIGEMQELVNSWITA